jgi:hypothetical protein
MENIEKKHSETANVHFGEFFPTKTEQTSVCSELQDNFIKQLLV